MVHAVMLVRTRHKEGDQNAVPEWWEDKCPYFAISIFLVSTTLPCPPMPENRTEIRKPSQNGGGDSFPGRLPVPELMVITTV